MSNSQSVAAADAFAAIPERNLRLFWKAYEGQYDLVSARAAEELLALPEFAAFANLVNEEERATQQEASRLRLALAVDTGLWEEYAEELVSQGEMYGEMGISFVSWYKAISVVRVVILPYLVDAYGSSGDDLVGAVLGMDAFFDVAMATIGTSYLLRKEATIMVQQDAIRELSTPVLPLREGMLILPVVGVVDSHRAYQLTQGLLEAIRTSRATVAVVDITGVPSVDSKVANHFIQTVEAAKLMGTVVILTGLSPAIAKALVTLGVDLTKLNTVGDLRGGVEEAERLLGYQVSQIGA
jgi:anti-anti-sigma regulatory factor